VLTGTTDPQEAADTLVELANEAGGRDNITVIVLDVTGDTPPVADREAEPIAVDDPDADPPTGAIPAPPGAPAAPVVPTPVGLASPDGSPPVGGWLDDEPPPTATTPVPPPTSPPEPPPPPAAESRRHRVTVRSVLFVVAVLAILGIAFGGITYYGRSGYYVGFVGDQVAVFKGQKGGILWVDPTLDGTYPLRRDELTPAWQQNLDRTISFTSRAAADAWFDTLRSNPAAVVPPDTTTSLAPTTAVAPDTTTTAADTAPSGP
jgi:PPM family protein phosphatase